MAKDELKNSEFIEIFDRFLSRWLLSIRSRKPLLKDRGSVVHTKSIPSVQYLQKRQILSQNEISFISKEIAEDVYYTGEAQIFLGEITANTIYFGVEIVSVEVVESEESTFPTIPPTSSPGFTASSATNFHLLTALSISAVCFAAMFVCCLCARCKFTPAHLLDKSIHATNYENNLTFQEAIVQKGLAVPYQWWTRSSTPNTSFHGRSSHNKELIEEETPPDNGISVLTDDFRT